MQNMASCGCSGRRPDPYQASFHESTPATCSQLHGAIRQLADLLHDISFGDVGKHDDQRSVLDGARRRTGATPAPLGLAQQAAE